LRVLIDRETKLVEEDYHCAFGGTTDHCQKRPAGGAFRGMPDSLNPLQREQCRNIDHALPRMAATWRAPAPCGAPTAREEKVSRSPSLPWCTRLRKLLQATATGRTSVNW